MYSKNVLNIFSNPKNAGRISKPGGVGENYNEDKTAHVEFSIKVENSIITACKFRAQANPFIVAVCQTMTTMVTNKMYAMLLLDPISVLKQLGDEQYFDIGFCINALRDAIDDYKKKLEKIAKN